MTTIVQNNQEKLQFLQLALQLKPTSVEDLGEIYKKLISM